MPPDCHDDRPQANCLRWSTWRAGTPAIRINDMEYQDLSAASWQMDLSEMFVLMGLIFTCLRRLLALFMGMDRPLAPATRASGAQLLGVCSQQHPLARVPVPTPRLAI